jgi:hypothetical protein
VILGPGDQVDRALDAIERDAFPAYLQQAADQRVVTEQAIDDPDVEPAY